MQMTIDLYLLAQTTSDLMLLLSNLTKVTGLSFQSLITGSLFLSSLLTLMEDEL